MWANRATFKALTFLNAL